MASNVFAGIGIQVAEADRTLVREYLAQYPELFDAAKTASETLKERLSGPLELASFLYRDPEFDDAYLTLLVRAPDYGPATLQALDAAFDACRSTLAGSSGWLLVTTDFGQIE